MKLPKLDLEPFQKECDELFPDADTLDRLGLKRIENPALYCEILPTLVAKSIRKILSEVLSGDLGPTESIDGELTRVITELLEKHIDAIRAVIDAKMIDVLASKNPLCQRYQDELRSLDGELNYDGATGDMYVFQRHVLLILFATQLAEKIRNDQ